MHKHCLPTCPCAHSVVGLTSGMDTICGQTYGAAQYAAVGVILQRALLVCLLLGLPSYAIYWQAEPLLLMLGGWVIILPGGLPFVGGLEFRALRVVRAFGVWVSGWRWAIASADGAFHVIQCFGVVTCGWCTQSGWSVVSGVW